ncbi:YadA domain protein, partial [Taylorella asinigenitalis 14/45]
MNKVFKSIYSEAHGKKSKSLLACAVAMSPLFSWGVALASDNLPKAERIHKASFVLTGEDSTSKSEDENLELINPDFLNSFNNPSNKSINLSSILKPKITTPYALVPGASTRQANDLPHGDVDGIGSFALNYQSNVKGDDSGAIGRSTEVIKGNGTFAIGHESKAIGWLAIAIGHRSIVEAPEKMTNQGAGYGGMALGHFTEVYGWRATVLGYASKAFDIYGLSLGHWSQSRGYGSTVVGLESYVNNEYGLALGNMNISGFNLKNQTIQNAISNDMPDHGVFITQEDPEGEVGFNKLKEELLAVAADKKVGSNITVGIQNVALYSGDVAVGYNNYAVGQTSVALGLANINQGAQSTAVGLFNEVKAGNSQVLGNRVKATQTNSVYLGDLSASDGWQTPG